MNNWISVNDRLPEVGQYVFCYMGNYMQYQKYAVCRFEKTEICGNNKVPYRWSEFGPMTFFGQDCTHWQPLPHPPIVSPINEGE